MKILVYLAVWKRPEITEVCFQGIKRLQTHPDFQIEALAVISEEEMIPLCERYGIQWVMHENLPVGKKKNFGLQAAKDIDFDWMMEIGSDDLVLNCLLDDYKKFMVKYDFIGVQELAFVDSETGMCRRLTEANTIGAGRMISRKALELVDWKLWRDDFNRGLDTCSIRELYFKGIRFWQIPKQEYPKVIDIKSGVNIWRFNQEHGHEYDLNILVDKLSESEKEFFACLPVKN